MMAGASSSSGITGPTTTFTLSAQLLKVAKDQEALVSPNAQIVAISTPRKQHALVMAEDPLFKEYRKYLEERLT